MRLLFDNVLHPELYWGLTTRGLLPGANLFGAGSEQTSGLSLDILLAIAVSKWGWIVFAVILAVFVGFIAKGFYTCLKQQRALGSFVSLAICVTFALQVFGNVAFNLGAQWVRPYSLPFMSFDSISTVVNLGLLGVMLSVFRTGNAMRSEKLLATRPQTVHPEK